MDKTNDIFFDSFEKVSKDELALYIATLLFQMAYADKDFHDNEHIEIVRQLNKFFSLGDEDAFNIVEDAQNLQNDEKKLQEIFDTINEVFSSLQKEQIYNIILEIGIADGIITKEEIELARELKKKLLLDKE